MKKHIILASSFLFLFSQGYAQTINKELKKNSPLLQEQPSGHLKAEDVLNGNLHWKTPAR